MSVWLFILVRNLYFSCQMILSHKLRSILSMLGIVVGTASLIITLAIGEGTKEQILKIVESMGTNMFIIKTKPNHQSFLEGNWKPLTLSDTQQIKKQIPQIQWISGFNASSVQIESDAQTYSWMLQGVENDFFMIRGFQLQWGRFMTAMEVSQYQNVCVLGAKVAEQMFNKGRLDTIYFNDKTWKVLGVLEDQEGQLGDSISRVIYIPVTTMQVDLNLMDEVSSIYIGFYHEVTVDLRQKVINLVQGLKGGDLNYLYWDQKEVIEKKKSITNSLKWALGSLALIALWIGGIGIMNVLLASVAERVREVGLRLALGASPVDIFIQFIGESIILCSLGGGLGILLGISICGYVEQSLQKWLSDFGEWKTIFNFSTIIFSYGFSLLTGLIFGVFPAKKAIQNDPCESLGFY